MREKQENSHSAEKPVPSRSQGQPARLRPGKNHIEAIIFDLGRVLVDVVISDEFRSALDWPSAEGRDDGERRRVFERLYTDFSTGRLAAEQFHRRLCRQGGLHLAYREFVRLWCSLVHPLAGAEQLFYEVAQCLPVGLLSDTDPLHWQHVLEHYPFVGRIVNPTLSFRIGVLKPDPRAYRAAADNVGCPPPACLFIDDKPENVDGARQVGMNGVVFRGVDDLRRQLHRLGLLRTR